MKFANPISSPDLGIRARVNDVLGSAAPSVLTISFGLSYSVLIFSGPLTPYLPY